MNRNQAQRLLEVLRPNGADDPDPRFLEALRFAQRDPKLGQWLEKQRDFDGIVASKLKSLCVPQDLKATILSSAPALPSEVPSEVPLASPAPPAGSKSPVRKWSIPSWPWNRWFPDLVFSNWKVATVAAAAVLLLLGTVAGLVAAHNPVRFADLREELVRDAWIGETHLEFKSTELGQIQQWLAAQGITEPLALPGGLRDMRLHGAQVMEANGQRVPMLCLSDGSKHLHLFVVSGQQFAGLPPQGTPDFEKYGAWKTAAWREGNHTYILSGLKTQAFVSKFRKAGRWTMSG